MVSLGRSIPDFANQACQVGWETKLGPQLMWIRSSSLSRRALHIMIALKTCAANSLRRRLKTRDLTVSDHLVKVLKQNTVR